MLEIFWQPGVEGPGNCRSDPADFLTGGRQDCLPGHHGCCGYSHFLPDQEQKGHRFDSQINGKKENVGVLAGS